MELKVIGAGFGRTGTSSLKAALDELGFGPCYHMSEVFAHVEHVKSWSAAAHGQPIDWDELFRDYRATVDWPGAAFYKELMERYPDAKVILTLRDPERWYESARGTIYAIHKMTSSSPVFSLAQYFAPRRRRAGRMINDVVWQGAFGGDFEDREHAIELFQRHNAEVRRHVPADRLLVYEVKQGWQPLCAFLGVEAPRDKPFPHLNDTAEFKRMIRIIAIVAHAVPLAVVSLILGAFMALRRRRRA